MKYVLWVAACVAVGIGLSLLIFAIRPNYVIGWCSEQRGSVTVSYQCQIPLSRTAP